MLSTLHTSFTSTSLLASSLLWLNPWFRVFYRNLFMLFSGLNLSSSFRIWSELLTTAPNILRRTASVQATALFFACMLNPAWLFVTPWTTAHQVPRSMDFPRKEYWSWLPFPPPGYLPDPGIEPCLWHLLYWQMDSLPPCYLESPGSCLFHSVWG